jgi:hypothetical protein
VTKPTPTSPQYSALADECHAWVAEAVFADDKARDLLGRVEAALRTAEALEQRVREAERERDDERITLLRRARAAEQQVLATGRQLEAATVRAEAAEAAVAKAREGAYEHIGWIQMIGDKPKMCFNEGTRDPRTVHDNGKPCFPVYALRSRTPQG